MFGDFREFLNFLADIDGDIIINKRVRTKMTVYRPKFLNLSAEEQSCEDRINRRSKDTNFALTNHNKELLRPPIGGECGPSVPSVHQFNYRLRIQYTCRAKRTNCFIP
jgi:hypothetical protein